MGTSEPEGWLGTYWVCVDCYFALVGADDNDETPDREPLSLFSGDVDLTPGMLAADHDPDCERETDGDCECEEQTFSWSPCAGCGSILGGIRYAVTAWKRG